MRGSTGDMLKLMQRADLSLPRMATLMLLARRENVTISDVSEHLNLTLGTTSHIVDQLVESGHIARTECQIDRRQKRLVLTDVGQAFVAEFERERIADISRQLRSLPEPLLQRALAAMSEVVTCLRDVRAETVQHQ
jgi:DNA-binding MarR family transcriptional regulator